VARDLWEGVGKQRRRGEVGAGRLGRVKKKKEKKNFIHVREHKRRGK